MVPEKINIEAVIESIKNTIIKIRVFRKSDNKLFVADDVYSGAERGILLKSNEYDDVMSYCCKDKDGEDVFAGDIVLKHDNKTKAVIYYDSDSMRFQMTPWWYGEAEDAWCPEQIKKIGNIYENADLLGETI